MSPELIEVIRRGFSDTPHPGDRFLQGSREGRDAFEAVEPFRGVSSWDDVESEVLDQHYDALSFLSEGGLRFFLPAYMIADLNDELMTADVVFHLTHGFLDQEVEVPIGSETFVRKMGRSVLLNPRRFGAMTSEDYARYRLSVFNREEASAIVAYLEHKRTEPDSYDAESIDAALAAFWRPRAESAPTGTDLAAHLEAEQSFLAAIEEQPPT